jgi:UDP:flavonoid glycosyltransferase YjiC (YdhE family)
MHILLTAIGSYGDVHPFVGFGKALAARGHEVAVVANPYFASLIERAGLAHLPLGTREEYEQLGADRRIWRTFHGPRIVLREGMANLARPLYEIVAGHCRLGETVVAAHPLDLGSRIAHERLGVPMASVELAPMVMRSVHAPPKMPGLPRRGPRGAIELYYWLVDHLVVDRILSRPINTFRREVGLDSPVRRFAHGWWYSPQLVLCLWPAWFGPVQPDWPPHCEPVGFPLWDEADQEELPGELERFLDDGEPPLVFTPGSANSFAREFFEAAVKACGILRRRGVLLTKYADQVPSRLPPGVKHFEFVPLSRLLPRSAAFIHHGGIGSSSQALAAGVPQLVRPMAFDQPDNAERLAKLGVAEVLPPRKFRAAAAAAALQRLTTDAERRQRCQDLARRCDGVTALSHAADLLERLGAGREMALASG